MRTTIWKSPLVFLSVCVGVWLVVGGLTLGVFSDLTVLPVWLVLGSVAVPGTALVALIAARPRWSRFVEPRLSANFLILTCACGGVLAITVGGTVDALARHLLADPSSSAVVSLVASAVEEAAKLVSVVAFGSYLTVKSPIAGALVGTAVGLGFAAFENIGYAMQPFIDNPFSSDALATSALIQLFRQSTSLFTHPLWTAVLGAAAFMALGRRSPRGYLALLLVFVGVVCSHAAWDWALTSGPATVGVAGVIGVHTIVLLGLVAEFGFLAILIRRRQR